MNLRADDDTAALSWLAQTEDRLKAAPGYSGGTGGPSFSDAFGSKRAPSQWELANAFRGLVYALCTINMNAVARQPLRLYATTGRGQSKPKCCTVNSRRDVRVRNRIRRMSTKAVFSRIFTKAEDVEEVAESPLLEAIDNPNQDFDRDRLIKHASMSNDLFGAWYWSTEIAGPKIEIFPLFSQNVLPVKLAGASITDYFQYFGQRYVPDELIHGRVISARDPYSFGYGPTQAAFEYVKLVDRYVSVRDSILASPRPGFIASNKDEKFGVGKDEGRRWVDEVNRKWAAGGVGRIEWVDGSIDVNQISHSISDITSAGIDDTGLEGMAACYGVPVSLLKTRDVNKANAEAGHRQHAEMGVEPRCLSIASGLTRWARSEGSRRTMPNGGKLGWDRVFFAFDDPVMEDREVEAKIIDMKLARGETTINEARAKDGEEPVEWGEEPWLPGTLVQPSAAAEQREHQRTMDQAGLAADELVDEEEEPSDVQAKKAWTKAEREDDAAFFPTRTTPTHFGSSVPSPIAWEWPTGTWAAP